jgi:hypothetical protein
LNAAGGAWMTRKVGGAMFPTKILLATDGSAEAEQAARMATNLSDSVVHHADCPVLVVRESKGHDTKGAQGVEERTGIRAPDVEA